MLLGRAAFSRGPELLELDEDPLAELVPGSRESERRVGVQALQPGGASLTANPAGELGPQAALVFAAALSACAKLGILPREPAPTLHPSPRLDPRERGNQMRAGQVVRRRERLARLVERRLLGNRRTSERTAHGDAPEGPWRPSELALDNLFVIHPDRSD